MDGFNKAVITGGMVIDGDIKSTDPIEIHGSVRGNVVAPDADITGNVVGDVTVDNNVNLSSARLTGNISAGANLKFSQDSVVVGDINAASGTLAGAVKGTVSINSDVLIEDSAIVYGDVHCQKVQLNSGAIVEGRIHQQVFNNINLDDMFNDKMAK